jgi:hypothetical protein
MPSTASSQVFLLTGSRKPATAICPHGGALLLPLFTPARWHLGILDTAALHSRHSSTRCPVWKDAAARQPYVIVLEPFPMPSIPMYLSLSYVSWSSLSSIIIPSTMSSPVFYTYMKYPLRCNHCKRALRRIRVKDKSQVLGCFLVPSIHIYREQSVASLNISCALACLLRRAAGQEGSSNHGYLVCLVVEGIIKVLIYVHASYIPWSS